MMDFYRYVSDEDRTIEAAWQHNLNEPLLKGHVPLRNIPRLMPTCARIYLMSMFTDSECERQYLIDNVYIKLKEYCRSAHGIEFQVVDLRSGIERQSQHALPSISHISKFEIKQCQNTSSGPCFVALIGQRYCNEAIPPLSIPQAELDSRKEALQNNNHDISLLEKHYKLDTNHQPAQYLLHPIMFDTNKWVETERRISELLNHSSTYLENSEWSDPPSDLSEELHAGLFNLEKQKFRNDNCIMITKQITNIDEHLAKKRASRFIDLYPGTNTIDKETQQALGTLVDTARHYVTPNNQFDLKLKWSEPAGISSVAHKDYLTQLGNLFYEQVRRHVDICMIEWGHYPDDPLYIEVQQHWLCTRANLEHFYEQGQYIQSINNYISSQADTPLIVYGVSGCGKSAILSNIASSVCEKSSSLRVILRHLGNTPASCDIEQLLHSLIKQLCSVMGMAYTQPKTFLEAKLRFRNILESGYCNCTLLLVIDGLDQLAASGYDQIDWLPLKLSQNIKMIVSMRDSDPRNTLSKVQSRYTDPQTFLEVKHMLPEICEWVLENKLRDAGHAVTEEQWKVVCQCLNQTPYPLYFELVFQRMLLWRSFTFPYLPDNIPGVIDLLLEELESGHGALVTSHITSLITCSKYGLSESEIDDILSIDDELLASFATPQSRCLSVQRVPCLVWSRMKLALQPYLSVWKVDNINLITWRYTQIAEAVERRYMRDDSFSQKIHGLIAEYFTGVWSGINKKPNKLISSSGKEKTLLIGDVKDNIPSSSHRNVLSQPLIISGHGTDARINVRKLNELAHHLAMADRITELREKVLFNYSWLHTKLSVMPMARLLSDYDLYTDNEISLVRQALDDIKTEFNPDILGVELTGRLLPYYSEYPNICKLIDQCDLEAMRRCSTVPALQLYQTPGAFLQHQFQERVDTSPTLQMLIVSKPDASYLLTKHKNRSSAVMMDVNSYESTQLNRVPDEGEICITPNQERIIAKRGRNIESYQIDSRQLEFTVSTDDGPISSHALSNAYFVFSIKQKTGPFVVDLKFPSVVHTFKHHTTAIDISDDSEMMVCNDGESLQVYELPLMTRHCSITTDDVANQIGFTSDHNTFCVLSSHHFVRMYTLTRRTKSATCTVVLQEPAIQNILFSPNNKSLLLIHSKKYIKLYSCKGDNSGIKRGSSAGSVRGSHIGGVDCRSKCTISELSHSQSTHDFVSAAFNHDGSKVIAARERSIGVYDSGTGDEIRQSEVPFPCDILSCFSCPNVDRAVTVLQNGLVQVWNLGYDTSGKKHVNNYYPGEVSSFSVSRCGTKMAVCNVNYPDAKLIECSHGAVERRLYDSFAAGSQPLSVEISPCGRYIITRCSNDSEGTIGWPVLRSDYVWSAAANRVTHFFINSYSVTFSTDDDVVVSLSCIGYSPADPSNKFFVALCYKMQGKEASEHKVTLPDGDVIGQPLVYSEKKWLVCLIQPCIKTKFAGMVMEQRVDDVQGGCLGEFHEFYIVRPDNIRLYIFDLFTSSARDRRFVNCYDLIPEEKTFFINMRETDTQYHLLLMYSRGQMPPYKADHTVDMGHTMSKGMILYDLMNSAVLHHISDYLTASVPADSLLVTKHLTYIVHDLTVYNAKTGKKVRSLDLDQYDHSETIKPVLVLDGNFIALLSDNDCVVRLVNTRNSVERSHYLLHGTAVDMKVGTDDRTVYVSTEDGRVVVMTVILELCDPVTMLVRHIPSRSKP